jgi:hypothetical protein
MTGYSLHCPACGAAAEPADMVDNGVGLEPCGPYTCSSCDWVQLAPGCMEAKCQGVRCPRLELCNLKERVLAEAQGLTDEQLAEIQAVHAAATQGPYRWYGYKGTRNLDLMGAGMLVVMDFARWGMQSGQPICALRASARPTSDSGCTGWVTPCHRDYRDLSRGRGFLAQRRRHSPSAITRWLENGGGLDVVHPALPVVDGLSVADARRIVSPLGNAIVPQVAAEFIQAFAACI